VKLYVWKRVGHVIEGRHHKGGLVVVASNLDRAREEMSDCAIPVDCGAYDIDPDCVFQVADTDEPGVVALFTDRGRC